MACDWQPRGIPGSFVAQPESSKQPDQDPLLEFAIEHLKQEAAVVEAVTPLPMIEEVEPGRIDALTKRVERLERSTDRMSRQIRSLTSDVATLVAARRNNLAPDVRSHVKRAPLTAAVATLAGAAAAAWFWLSPMNLHGPAPPVDAPVAASSDAETPPPAPPVVEPTLTKVSAQAVPAPSIRKPPARDTPWREEPRRVDYMGTLSSDASPDAEVFITRRPVGRTPVRLTNLKAGSHLVWIQRDGFRRFTRVVQVPADRVTRVSATLDPLATR